MRKHAEAGPELLHPGTAHTQRELGRYLRIRKAELGAKADCCPDASVSEVVMIADSAAFTMIPPWVALELMGRVLEAIEET